MGFSTTLVRELTNEDSPELRAVFRMDTVTAACILQFIYLMMSLTCYNKHVITNSLSFTQHICECTTKAHRRANSVLRCFVSRDNGLHSKKELFNLNHI